MNIQEITQRNRGLGKAYSISFILLVVLTKFFDFLYIPGKLLSYVGIIILLYFYFESKQDSYKNKLWIGVIGLMVLGSILYSHFIHGQSFREVAESSYFAMGLASFCIFNTLRLSYKDSVKLIKWFSIFFCICYIVQTIIYPTELFTGVKDDFSVNENQFRMRMACSGCSYCLFFYGINSFMKTHKVREFIYSMLGFIPFIIMGFRSLVFLTMILTIYMVVKYNQKQIKNILSYTAIFCVLLAIVYQIPGVQYKIEEMENRQEEQSFRNVDYVRYIALDYYSNEVFNTPAVRFFGGGVPLTSVHKMNWSGEYVSLINKGYQVGLYWNDLGLIGFGFIFGFPSVILLSFLIFRTVFKCKEQNLIFIRATLLTLYFASIFTSQELYRSGNFVFIGLLMYTEYKYHLSLVKK